MNTVILMGNMTRDPELRYTANGTAVAGVGIAVTEKRKGKDGNKSEHTIFVDLTFWGKRAEVVCKYFQKGSPILVQGRLDIQLYEKDGQKRRATKVIVNEFNFVGGRRSESRPFTPSASAGIQQAPATPGSFAAPSQPYEVPGLAGGAPSLPDEIAW